MEKNKSIEIFSEAELSELELLEIKGGRADMNVPPIQIAEVCGTVQYKCTSNNVAGCGCS